MRKTTSTHLHSCWIRFLVLQASPQFGIWTETPAIYTHILDNNEQLPLLWLLELSPHSISKCQGFRMLIWRLCVARLLVGNVFFPALISNGTGQHSFQPISQRDCYSDLALESVPCGLVKQAVYMRWRDLNSVSRIKSLVPSPNIAAVNLPKFATTAGKV